MPTVDGGTGGPKVGISCSGGGIRAAAYALGCLQTLDEHGMLHGEHRADHLSAVSGGSYLVGGLTAVQASLGPGTPPEVSEPAAFAPGSPEVRRLRNRLGYLTHGPGGVGPELWRVVLGIVLNVAALLTLVATVARPVGWLYGWLLPEVRWGCANPAVPDRAAVCRSTAVGSPTWGWVGLAVLGGAAVLLGLVVSLRRGGGRPVAWRVSFLLFAAAVVWGVAVLGLPQLLGWLHRARLERAGPNPAVATSVGGHVAWVPLGGLTGLLASIGVAVAPVWRFLNPPRASHPSTGGGSTPSTDGASGGVRSWAGRFVAGHRTFVLNLLASVTGPVLVVGAFLLFVYRGASRVPGLAGGGDAFEVVRWLWPAALLGLLAQTADVNSWSLHSLYRQRLADAFDLERVVSTPPVTPPLVPMSPDTYPQPASPTSVGGADVRQRAVPLSLADAQPPDFPEVLVCATANLTTYGVTPTDQKAAPFVFSGATVGGPAVGSMRTSDYVERAFGKGTDLSLLDAVSISGAAVAPLMGKMTRAPLRFLLALANVRLGVWVPNPTRVQADAAYTGMFRRPGLSHLFREMAGSNSRSGRFVYVSDGGHFDNLGLVELLARRCDWIWAVDASGDQVDTFSTLGQALAIAHAELGVTVDIDPTVMAPSAADPAHVRATHCRGVVHYPVRPADPADPDSVALPAKDATLVVVKAGVPVDAPWDVASYAAANPRFPCDPTSDQLYNAPRFDAYVSLGSFSMRQAWERWGSDLEVLQGRVEGPVAALPEASALMAPRPFTGPPPA